MFGCASYRDKTAGLGAPTVRPAVAKCVCRAPSTVTLEFDIEPVDGRPLVLRDLCCRAQFLHEGTLTSDWVFVDTDWEPSRTPGAIASEDFLHGPNGAQAAAPEKLDAADREAAAGRVQCLATVRGLQPERTYSVRILARGSGKEVFAESEPIQCRTSDRPKAGHIEATCTGRTALSLDVAWEVPDPSGAPVLECELQYRAEGLLTSWEPAPLSAAGQASRPVRLWQGRIAGLQGATAYRIRARARNAVGWSLDTSPEATVRTSDRPPPPVDLFCLRRCPTSATIAFSVHDPEGAPVNAFEAQVRGLVGFPTHTQRAFLAEPAQIGPNGLHVEASRRVLCTLEGLQPEADYAVRLLAQNDAGASRRPSEPLQFRTSDRPRAVAELCVQVGPRSLMVEWNLEDPIGAPVTSCELLFCRNSMFSSWESREAEPITASGAGPEEEVRELVEIAAKVSVAEVVASRPLLRRWRVLLGGLERESTYQLRARSTNLVGCSADSGTICATTSDRPPAPHRVRCLARLPAGVRLEVCVAEVLGTSAIERIVVERGSSFSWQEVPEVECRRLDPTEEGESRWEVLAHLGASPGAAVELRAWAANIFGRSGGPSETLTVATSDRPRPPSAAFCAARRPHALWLEWAVEDPEGAPVWRFDVQVKQDQAFSSWQTSACADTTRREPGDVRWRSIVESLEASTAYRVAVRAFSEVGWSEWSPEFRFETSGHPSAPSAALALERRRVAPAQVGGDAAEGLSVGLALADPDGAPVLACLVSCGDSAAFVLARREGRPAFGGDDDSPEHAARRPRTFGRWSAWLPMPFDRLGGKCEVSVRVANAVGWTRCAPQAAEVGRGDDDVEAPCPAGGTGTLDLVLAAARAASAEQESAQARLAALLAEATARRDEEGVAALLVQRAEVSRRMDVLREVVRQVGPASGASVAEDGAQLAKELKALLQRRRGSPSAAAAAMALALLLRAYLWLERPWRAELQALSNDIARARGSIPTSGGCVLMQWVEQHQTWSESFDRRVAEALPDGLARAAQLLAALAGGRRPEALGCMQGDLQACWNFVTAAERQLRRLRNSHRILCCAEASSCHDFQKKGVLSKIETSALGLVTMLVLPVPGSIEFGTVSIGMLWLEEDTSRSHLAVEHPTGVPLAPMLQRLGSSPPPRSAIILRGWGSGGNRGVVLVHNATPRRIIVKVSDKDRDSLTSKAIDKFSAAHPFVRAATHAMAAKDGGDSIVIIPPTEVALIQVPDVADTANRRPVRLEFAYGTGSSPDKAVGFASVLPGSAVSFMRLDSPVQVSNGDETLHVEDGTIKIVNNDLAPATVCVYRAPEQQQRFESALITQRLEVGEQRDVPLPQPCTGRIFQLTIAVDGAKSEIGEVRPGQCLHIEGVA